MPSYTLQKQIRQALTAGDPHGLVLLEPFTQTAGTFYHTVLRHHRDDIIALAIKQRDWVWLKLVIKAEPSATLAVYQAISQASRDDNNVWEQLALNLDSGQLMLQLLLAFANSHLSDWTGSVLTVWLDQVELDPILSQVELAAQESYDTTTPWDCGDFVRGVYCSLYQPEELQYCQPEVIEQLVKFFNQTTTSSAELNGLSYRGQAGGFETIFQEVLAAADSFKTEWGHSGNPDPSYGADTSQIPQLGPEWLFVLYQYPNLVAKYHGKVSYYDSPCQNLELIWNLFETTDQLANFVAAYRALAGGDSGPVNKLTVLLEYGLEI